MKKNRLKEIIKEVLLEEKGYSKYIPGGKTDGLTQDTLEQILLNIANEEEIEEKYEGDPERGNKILDTADQENVDRILRGEEPEVDRMKELAGLKKEITVNNPTLPNQSNEEFTDLDDFYEDYPNLDFKDIIKKVNKAGYIFSNNSYYDNSIDLEKGDISYYGSINFDGTITIFDENSEDVEII